MELTGRQRSELSYLAARDRPIWQGVLKRVREGVAQPFGKDRDFEMYLREGLIKEQGDGYVISERGRELIGIPSSKCPHCGRDL